MSEMLELLRAGDHILVGCGAGEPTTLVDHLLEHRHELPAGVRLLLGYNLTGAVRPELVGPPEVVVLGGYGANRALVDAGVADVLPVHQSSLPGMVLSGELRVDVAFVQCSPPDADGFHSLGITADVTTAATRVARVVVAEVNDQMPRTRGPCLPADAITYAVHTSRMLPELKPGAPSTVEQEIAEHVAELIPDRAVLQFGIGRIPDAIGRLLCDHHDLGVHSGLLGDWVVDLVEAGAVTNATKKIDTGVTVGGVLMGTRRLYDWAHDNPRLAVRGATYTHGASVLAELDNLVTVNGAMEIDLTGQVNAEVTAGGSYVGAIGGQVDYVRGGAASAHGRSILVLPAMVKSRSTIVPRLTTPVTTARSDVDTVVTEHGVAHLRGRPLAERARLLAEIADPSVRDELLRVAGHGSLSVMR